ncbi:MAG: nitrate- and nitrite sensing domain-containing protein, partial [Hydrogenophaga sp.]|nr:nitrate- and nitrite sensing domain-containing protein [Hydrogenophaga sp.]
MKTGLHFLIAAKRCEIAELQELTQTSALVRVTARLVHGLQRERGLSNLFLASLNGHWQPELDEQVAACVAMQQELLDGFGSMDIEPRLGQGARLFSRVAYVMQGLDALPALRQQVRTRAWTPQRATQAYIRLINGLLAVVFEAADSAGDPDISRRLVALFNFMQGKELAGQERASGAAAFGSGRADTATQQHLLHLIDSQERCLQVFADFASDDLKRAWQQAQQADTLAGLERLRRVICTAAPGQVLDTGQTQKWFDACTARMDAMKGVEDRLADELQGLCAQRQELARGELAVLER